MELFTKIDYGLLIVKKAKLKKIIKRNERKKKLLLKDLKFS